MIQPPLRNNQPPVETGPFDKHGLPQMRADAWNRLRDAARRIRRIELGSAEHSRLQEACRSALGFLDTVERYHAFPGYLALRHTRGHFEKGIYEAFSRQTIRLVRLMSTDAYRRLDLAESGVADYSDLLDVTRMSEAIHARLKQEQRPYFEVLLADDLTPDEAKDLRSSLRALRRSDDAFLYEVVVVSSFEDALLATLINPNLESCVVRNTFPFETANRLGVLRRIYNLLGTRAEEVDAMMPSERSLVLGRLLRAIRPELDLFLVTDAPVEDVAGEPSDDFTRVFYQQEDFLDLHLSILKGIHARFETPFFEAVRAYSQKPTGMFHALPISRGRTIAKSHWIKDMGRFYGNNIFLAETSATTGGLDSLLQPTGSLRRAQELAARAFGSRRTYFVTNGTSTANKIVMQSLVQPGDIILLAHDCHKSHPYAVILAGALPVYLDAYPLTEYSMYGGVPLREIKRTLLGLKRSGKLDRVRLLLLTNLTFDGITYDPMRIMKEVLAIKPDMIFVWDEAWFAYGRFSPLLRTRTAMSATSRLLAELRSADYQSRYRDWQKEFDSLDASEDATWLDRPLWPDPEKARLRVYATHSTHKTLTALRQGSMIHIHDQDFETRSENEFHEAYMTHTSTSPNYQILASLDVGRRQVELEGYDLVERSIEAALILRSRVNSDPLLQKYFRILTPGEMVPACYRPSGLLEHESMSGSGSTTEVAWRDDEFVLDPTRITLHVGRTGMNGDTFKKLLIDQYDIHVNKTSRNTILLLIHIGMTRGTLAHLLKVLARIARTLNDQLEHQSGAQAALQASRVRSLNEELPPLPNFSAFHPAFRERGSDGPEGDVRRAFFLAYDEGLFEYRKLDHALARTVHSTQDVVSAAFVTPYPPGFPVLVPGQIISSEIVEFLLALDVTEIHGYDPNLGLRVFSARALAEQTPIPTSRKSSGAAREGVTR